MTESNCLISVTLDDSNLAPPTPEIEQERRVAVFELLENNTFGITSTTDLPAPSGPYALELSIRERKLQFSINPKDTTDPHTVSVSLAPFRQVVKDYFQICESYFDAVKRLPPAQIEALDEGRRGIHNEGSRMLLDRLDGKIETDIATSRRLFTLICALQASG